MSGIGAVSASESSVSVSGGGDFSCSCTRFTFIESSRLNYFKEPNHAFERVKENVENVGTWSEALVEKKPMKNNCIYGPSIFDFYTLLDVIGSGTSGVVRLGQHKEVRKDLALLYPPDTTPSHNSHYLSLIYRLVGKLL